MCVTKSPFLLVKKQHFSPSLPTQSPPTKWVASARPKVSAFTCVSLCPVGVNAVPPEEEDPEEEAVEQDCLTDENEATWHGTAADGGEIAA